MKQPKKKTVISFTEGETLVESIFDRQKRLTEFVISRNGKVERAKSYKTSAGLELVPYSPEHAFLADDVILLPSKPCEYRTPRKLIEEVQSYIHKYVDLSEAFEIIAAHYALLTWLYDKHPVIGYLRIKGDFGTGKTRFLQIIGSICYKPIFASGSATVAPIFHMLNDIGGTLVMDESDFHYSNEKSLIAKILNNGNAKGFPVLRCEKQKDHSFTTRSFTVYGPKIMASRDRFDDDALESRFFTEEAGIRKLRENIPLKVGEDQASQAQILRNKLLQFRFDHIHKNLNEQSLGKTLSARTIQIAAPLLSFMNETEKNTVIDWLKGQEHQARNERGMGLSAHTLAAVNILLKNHDAVQVGRIREYVVSTFGDYYDYPPTSHAIGRILRNTLHIRTTIRNGRYCVPHTEKQKVKLMLSRYGL